MVKLKTKAMNRLMKTCLVLLTLNLKSVFSIEPISSTIAGILGAVGLTAVYSAWDYLKCSSHECCHKAGDNKAIVKDETGWHREPWIDYEARRLNHMMNSELYGQHLVKTIISPLIAKHMANESPKKALVLSFHGWTGGGKNFVAEIVAKSLFRKFRESGRSDFVKHVICTHLNTNDKHLMRQWIATNVSDVVKTCGRSLFIFDEIDKLSPGVIDAIKPFVDEYNFVDSVDYRKSIFIFLSNTGGTGITTKTYDFYLSGKERTDLTVKDLEPLINSGAFNENGGLYKSDIVEKNLIDAYVPFLPLERKHIKLCVIDYLKQRYNKSNPLEDPGEEFIRTVCNQMEYFPPDTQLYSKTGCKRVRSKVDLQM